MTFGAPLYLILTLAAPLVLWIARGGRPPARRVPSVALLPPAPAVRAPERRTRPLWAWLAAAAAVLGAVAAADPRTEAPDVSILLEDGPAMARVDGDGRSRFERARAALVSELLGLGPRSRCTLLTPSGLTEAGSAASIRGVVESLAPVMDLTRPAREAPTPRSGRRWAFISGDVPPKGVKTWVFGAIAENVGLVAAYRAEGSLYAVVGNGGTRPRTVRVVAGDRFVRRTLEPGGVATVPLGEALEVQRITLEREDGLSDALAEDDAIASPATGLDVSIEGPVPDPLRRALEAAAAALGPRVAASPSIRCSVIPPSGAPASKGPAIEVVLPAGAGVRRAALRPAGPFPFSDLPLFAEMAVTPVGVREPWLVDAADAAAVVGLDGATARMGLDVSDRRLEQSPLLPVLVAALVDECLRRSGSTASREPLWTLAPGAVSTRVVAPTDTGAESVPVEHAAPLAWGAGLLALLALGALATASSRT